MKKLLVFTLIFTLSVVFNSCKYDKKEVTDALVQKSFNSRYPLAQSVSWKASGEYFIARFVISGNYKEAWFVSNGKWYMTVTELEPLKLPEIIRKGVESLTLSGWEVAGCYYVEKEGVDDIYAVELELEERKICRLYSDEGIFLKSFGDADSRPWSAIPAAEVIEKIIDFTRQKYPDASIKNYCVWKDRIAVDILDEVWAREVKFTPDAKWFETVTPLDFYAVPLAAREVIISEYWGYIVSNQSEHIETPTLSYYVVELEKDGNRINVHIDSRGNILKEI